VLLATDSVDEGEASIEAFYDMVVDIVSKQMGLTRRQYDTAHKDAKTLVCILRTKNIKALPKEKRARLIQPSNAGDGRRVLCGMS
jgi:hypothetical protein